MKLSHKSRVPLMAEMEPWYQHLDRAVSVNDLYDSLKKNLSHVFLSCQVPNG